jgi:hypothetical protein
MRRLLRALLLLLIGLMSTFLSFTVPVSAQDYTYRNDAFGISFTVPDSWEVREQPQTQTLIAGSEDDLAALSDGGAPSGILFTVTLSSFRQIGAATPDDFPTILQRIAASGETPESVRVGGVEGVALTLQDEAQNVATTTLLLSIGERRVALLRSVATLEGWNTGGESQFDALIDSVSFFTPENLRDVDRIGEVIWRIDAPNLTNLFDISVNGDGSVLYVTDRQQGIWRVNANGTAGDQFTVAEVGQYAGVIVLGDNSMYLADPANHTLWYVFPDGATARPVVGGQQGTAVRIRRCILRLGKTAQFMCWMRTRAAHVFRWWIAPDAPIPFGICPLSRMNPSRMRSLPRHRTGMYG